MARTRENIDDVEELVLSLEDAPGTHRTMFHFKHKNDIVVNLTFVYWELLFLIPVLITYISETVLYFFEIDKIYANQIIVKVTKYC